jgi:chitinase
MANSPMAVLTFMAIGLAAALLSSAGPVAAQNCGCPKDNCCSKFGFCGTNSSYCGSSTCKSGPCTRDDVGSFVTDAFFDRIKSKSRSDCAGKRFYTREAFLSAVSYYSSFASPRSSDTANKQEIAAFFAHVTHETGRKLVVIQIVNKQEHISSL